MFADENVIKIKHEVLYRVAKLAFEGQLEEKRDFLPMDVIPGPAPQFRCCVYKEREIIRQRIRLVEGKAPGMEDDGNIVQVISSACEDCPISSYVVTDNCQNCLGKACINACRFGAITAGETRSKIDPAKCKECGLCAKSCPYNAIAYLKRPCKSACPVDAITYNEDGISVIDEKKCIRCGLCIHRCPFGAIGSKTFIIDVINAIKSDRPVFAMLAPATEGQFGENITMESWKKAVKKIGFDDFVEVGLGGDMTAAYEAEEWSEAKKEGRKMTTSCCPAFINMQRIHFPEIYQNNMSSTVSPMCAVSRYLKATHPGCVTVFIGPCIAKKSETLDTSVPGNADYAVTYGEIRALMRSKNVTMEPVETGYQEASAWGKKFASSGGVAAAVLECMKERGEDVSDVTYLQCAGGKDCRKNLMLLQNNRIEEDFNEGMVCHGGCVGGPSRHKTEIETMKARNTLLAQADGRKILENIKNYPMDKFSMKRDGT